MMKTLTSLLCVAHLLPSGSGVVLPPITYSSSTQNPLQSLTSKVASYFSDTALDAWIEKEERIAIKGLLANLAPVGRNAKEAAPGAVIASPSRGQPGQPNYYYQCTFRFRQKGDVTPADLQFRGSRFRNNRLYRCRPVS